MDYSKSGILSKQKALRSKGRKIGNKIILNLSMLILIAGIGVCCMGASAGIGIFKGILASAPPIGNIDVTPSGFSTFVYDSKGNQTAKLVATDANRIPVAMDVIPKNLSNAFVAIEDERFYEHNGIDIKGILRAGLSVLQTRSLSQGASTITQQLLKNSVFTGWTDETPIESIKRKVQEQYLAIELEKVMSKEEILLNYMNTINLGQNTLGVQSASMRYFNKPVNELTLSECAVIAGITQNPSKYNPISHPDKNSERRERVLSAMLSQGYINQAEYDAAIADKVYDRIQTTNQEIGDDSVNTYFVDALTNVLMEDLVAAGYTDTQAYTLLYSGGLKIYSTQDPDIQRAADNVFLNEENYPEGTRWLLRYELTVESADGSLSNYSSEMYQSFYKERQADFNMLYSSHEDAYAAIEVYKESVMAAGDEVYAENITLTPQPQVSFTIEDQSNGHVLAMIGGRGEKTASRTLNRATDSYRQPGSTFKVVSTFVPALDSAGLTLASVQNDAPFNYANGRPVNNWYDGYRGICSIRDGIRDSLNIVAVKTLTQITPQLGYEYLMKFGFTTLVDRKAIGDTIFSDIQQSLALGGITNGVKNIELNSAFATIANQGMYISPKLYTKVLDHSGNVILDNTDPTYKQIMTPQTAYLITNAMEDVVKAGTGTRCNFNGEMGIAGKTGTTSKSVDLWFTGYTPYYTATVWTGYDNNVQHRQNNGETNLAKNLWRMVMEEIHQGLPAATFEMPEGIESAVVCSRSGKLPIPGLCDATLKGEIFASGHTPTESCNVHYAGSVCLYDGLPASDTCPFKASGAMELPNILDEQLGVGTTVTTVDEEGNEVTASAYVRCQHDALFFANPAFQSIIESQTAELIQRGINMMPPNTDEE